MQLEFHPEEDTNKFEIYFDAAETDVLRAVARELIARMAREGEPEAVSPFHRAVARWREGMGITIKTPDVEATVHQFQTFHDDTQQAVNDILGMPGVPDCENGRIAYIPQRVTLGAEALRLAQQISEERGMLELRAEIESGCFASDLNGDS